MNNIESFLKVYKLNYSIPVLFWLPFIYFSLESWSGWVTAIGSQRKKKIEVVRIVWLPDSWTITVCISHLQWMNREVPLYYPIILFQIHPHLKFVSYKTSGIDLLDIHKYKVKNLLSFHFKIQYIIKKWGPFIHTKYL
jgi:hypothetical protein